MTYVRGLWCSVAVAGVCALAACGQEFTEFEEPPGGGGGEAGTASGGSGGAGATGGETGGTTSTSSGGAGGGGGCAADEKICDDVCVPALGDPDYGCWGDTCDPCALPGVEAHQCDGAACVIDACDATHLDCNGLDEDGCEVDLTSDPLNCGSCEHECASGACEASKCNPTCGPDQKIVTTQGVAICWEWPEGSPSYHMAMGGSVGVQTTTGTDVLVQADDTPCIAPNKTDKELVCAFGDVTPGTLVQLALYDYLDQNTFYVFRCEEQGQPAFCAGVVRVFRDGVEILPPFEDQGNLAPNPWIYAPVDSRWRVQRLIP